MSVSQDIVVAEGDYKLRNGEIAHLTERGPAHASIKTFESRAHPGHVWYGGGWCVKPCPNFYDYYPEDDPNWFACPDLYAVRASKEGENSDA